MTESNCVTHHFACECREEAFREALDVMTRISVVWCSNLIKAAGNREDVVNAAAGLRNDVERVMDALSVYVPKGVASGKRPKRKLSELEQEIERDIEGKDDEDDREDPGPDDDIDGAGGDRE